MNEELELHEIEGSASPDDGTAVEALDSFVAKMVLQILNGWIG